MPDIVHAFRHAFMLHKQNTQFEDAKHEETSLHVCPAVGGGGWVGGGRERLEEPFKFLDANSKKAALRTQGATGDTTIIR